MKLKYLFFSCFFALGGCVSETKITLETKLSVQDSNKLVHQLEGKSCYWSWNAGDAWGIPISPWNPNLTLSERILGLPKYDCQNYASQIISSKYNEFDTNRIVSILIGHLKYRNNKSYKGRYFPLRFRAIQALTEIKDPRAIDSLIGVIRDTRRCLSIQTEDFCSNADLADQGWAISALGEIGVSRPDIINLLMSGLEDKKLQVQQESAVALAKLRAKQAIIPIINLLQKDPNKALQVSAIRALGMFGTSARKAVPIIIQRIQQSENSPKDEIITLSEIGTPEAIATLDEFAKSGNPKINQIAKDTLQTFEKNLKKKSIPK
jgi:hypothetical protein